MGVIFDNINYNKRMEDVKVTLQIKFVMKVYPLKFKPIYKKRIWGGQKLREFFGKDIPASEKIGESWELTDLPEGQSVVANGEFADQRLESLINQ